MKVLCLHGRGTSGHIFKSQTSSIRSRLTDLDLDFDFLDGPYPSPPAPGVDLFYPPPYYSYYDETPQDTTFETLQRTHTWLSDIIAERGPYDLVLTFSQGSILAASMLLLHEAGRKIHALTDNTTDKVEELPIPGPPPFKSAIFICGGAPLPLLEHIGYNILPQTKTRDLASRAALASMASSSSILARGSTRWTSSGLDFDFTLSPNASLTSYPGPYNQIHIHTHAPLPSAYAFNKEEEIRREITGPVRITVPTVHIYGERDPRYIAGIQLSEVCERGVRKVYNHGGGHEIPRLEAISGAIADLVRWAVRAAKAEGDD
ncbi:serine hydrolase-domain-containing protein [Aspergillus karnatakaensis]|uniref:putative EF-hand calcium-binding domain protein n=1 Tax=Aspergillus karnatakaensis TaxID=1810916 RepID=UPI003CCDE76B